MCWPQDWCVKRLFVVSGSPPESEGAYRIAMHILPRLLALSTVSVSSITLRVGRRGRCLMACEGKLCRMTTLTVHPLLWFYASSRRKERKVNMYIRVIICSVIPDVRLVSQCLLLLQKKILEPSLFRNVIWNHKTWIGASNCTREYLNQFCRAMHVRVDEWKLSA